MGPNCKNIMCIRIETQIILWTIIVAYLPLVSWMDLLV